MREPRYARPDRTSITVSVVGHLAVAALMVWGVAPVEDDMLFEAVEIEMVAAGELQPAEEDPTPPQPEEPELETPEEPSLEEEVEVELPPPPEEEEPEEEEPEEPEEEEEPEEPEEEPEPEDEAPPQPEEDEEVVEPADEEAEEEVDDASEEIEVRMDGVRRDFPEYYQNIIVQMQRCFRPEGSGDLEAVVRFEIVSDGTVPYESIQLVERSGSRGFDLQAMGAVECAGDDRFGALPEELPYDVLPIQFRFSPP